MSRPKIVILDGATLNPGDNPWTEIESIGDVTVYGHTAPEEVLDRAAGSPVLVINKVKLPAEKLERLSDAKLIAVTATGFDCVDAAAAKKLGIAVCNVPIYGTDSVAQHTMALILSHCHHVELHNDAVHAGEWEKSSDFCFWKTPLIELTGKTLGVVGFGRIGRQVAKLANAFGMNILAQSRSRSNAPDWPSFAWADADEIFRTADFISLHCPMTTETKGMVNAQSLAQMKRTAVLINTSRGGLIIEADLAQALNEGQIAAALVDVLSVEPPVHENPLLTAKNCTITPHHAWATLAARERLMKTTADNIAAFLANKPQNVVNR